MTNDGSLAGYSVLVHHHTRMKYHKVPSPSTKRNDHEHNYISLDTFGFKSYWSHLTELKAESDNIIFW